MNYLNLIKEELIDDMTSTCLCVSKVLKKRGW